MSMLFSRGFLGRNLAFEGGCIAALITRLLVVDRKEPLLEVISTYLGGLGYEVDSASSDTRAQALVGRHPYGLMVLDLMHVHDFGVGLLQGFVRNNPRSPVIVLTSMGYENELLQTAFKNGATTSLSKTMPIEDLSRRIVHLRGSSSTAC